MEKGTVVIREGTIVEAGASTRAPDDAELVDGRGMTVYAGLIDPFTHLGMPKRAEGRGGRAGERRPGKPRSGARDVRTCRFAPT